MKSKIPIKRLLLIFVIIIFILPLRILAYIHRDDFFNSDTTRDIMYAKHIVDFNIYPSLGPWSGGSNNLLPNSKYYYYFLSTGYFLTHSETGIWLLLLMSNISFLLLLYILGQTFFCTSLGIILASFASINLQLLQLLKSIYQPNLIPTISLLCLYLLLLSIKHKSYIFLSLYFFVLINCLHLHYSIIAIMPMALFWGIYSYYQIFRNQHPNKFTDILPLIVLLSSFFFWLNTIRQSGSYMPISFIRNALSSVDSAVFIDNIKYNLYLTFSNLIKFGTTTFLPYITIIFIIFLGIPFIAITRYFKHQKQDIYSLVIFSFLCQIIIIGIYRDSFQNYYDFAFYPLIILCFILPILFFLKKLIFISSYKLPLYTLAFILISIQTLKISIQYNKKPNYQQYNTEVISKIKKEQPFNKSFSVIYSPGNNLLYNYLPYYYSLEKVSGTPETDNLEPIKINPSQNYFLICTVSPSIEPSQRLSLCLTHQLNNYDYSAQLLYNTNNPGDQINIFIYKLTKI